MPSAAPCALKHRANQLHQPDLIVFLALLCTDLGTAVATSVKASVVKRVLEAYAACAIQLAEVVKRKEPRADSGYGASEVDTMQKALHAKGMAARAASTKDVLAAKWFPP